LSKSRNFFQNVFALFKTAATEFYRDDGFNLSAGLAFFAMLAVIPIVMILISILGHYLGQSEQLFGEISGWVQSTVPVVQPDFIEFLRTLVDKKLTSGWVGILFLFFVASFLFANIEHLLDKILKSSRKRNFWHSRVLSIGFIFLTCFVLFTLLSFKVANQFLIEFGVPVERFEALQGNASYFVAHFTFFVLLLRFAPNELMRMRHILSGGLLFGALTVVASQIFRWYIQGALERYHFIYGSLTVLVLLVLWIYYLSIIFVFCGEVVNALQKMFPPEAPSE
jgi:membrane protein